MVILECALKHGLTEKDIELAVDNAIAARCRNFDPPCHYALAGADEAGNLIEVLVAETEDEELVAYHAMKLTSKMAKELGLE